jgi:hypothetical protein
MMSRGNLVLTKPAAWFSIAYPTRDVACRLLASARDLLGDQSQGYQETLRSVEGCGVPVHL